MKKSRLVYLKKWDERIDANRRKYIFEKIFSEGINRPTGIKGIIEGVIHDLRFILNQFIAAAKQLKVFGPLIRKRYGVPLYIQCYRLLFLGLIVRKSTLEYRKRLLFKNESWKNVKSYDYGQIHTQIRLATCSFPDEIPIIEDKYRFFTYCMERNIRTPEILAVFSDGKVIYPDKEIFELPAEDLFMKERSGGKGVRANSFSFQQGVFRTSDQKEYTEQQLLELILARSRTTDIIIQKRLQNHDLFKPFTPGALTTCRIVTIRKSGNGKIVPLYAVMRMPCGSNDVDNFAQGGILSTIELTTGKLGRGVTYVPYKGEFEFDAHPDTGQFIKGAIVPEWDSVLDFTISSHRHFNSLAVGWDVCYTESGLRLIEGNLRWGSSLYECPEQKPFRETNYPEIYGELISTYCPDETA